jgi:hypothetical protein
MFCLLLYAFISFPRKLLGKLALARADRPQPRLLRKKRYVLSMKGYCRTKFLLFPKNKFRNGIAIITDKACKGQVSMFK